MAFKTLLVIFILGVVGMSSVEIESNFHHEEPCAEKKGTCVLEKECPTKVTAEVKKLCAAQAKDGAICCENFPKKEVNCQQSHNECRESCPKNLNMGKMGCGEGTTCCALIL